MIESQECLGNFILRRSCTNSSPLCAPPSPDTEYTDDVNVGCSYYMRIHRLFSGSKRRVPFLFSVVLCVECSCSTALHVWSSPLFRSRSFSMYSYYSYILHTVYNLCLDCRCKSIYLVNTRSSCSTVEKVIKSHFINIKIKSGAYTDT